jgi:site-specific recombinase XerD
MDIFSPPPTPVQLPLFPPLPPAPPPATQSSPPAVEPAAPPTSLSAAAAAYLAWLTSNGRALHTVRSTRHDLDALVEFLGDVPLAQITPERLAAHVAWLRTARANRAASLRRKIATIKVFFRHCTQQGWLPRSPAEALRYPGAVRSPLTALTPTEQEAVVAQAQADPTWHALTLLLLDAGLKRDEALALRAQDLRLGRRAEESQVTVRRTREAKRLRRRTVPLTPRAHAALTRLLTAPLPGERLFNISVRGVNFVIETIGARAGLTSVRKLTPEVLRDTFAVNQVLPRLQAERALAAAGAPASDLEELQRQHDHEVLQLLGLSQYSDAMARYRALAARCLDAPPQP